jgi:4-hydroxy-2-oxoheptanedioate aldolase
MKLRPSRVLKLLRSGRHATVLKLSLADPRAVEVAGLSGADSVWLCNEHVPSDWSALENQIRAARVHNMDTVVRVSRGGYSDYVRPLEAGATGIMVPHVTSVDEALQAVDWLRFRPLGRRALDGFNVDGRFGQLPLKQYLPHSNAERFIILMIESPEGLANVEKIARVPGFDMLVFGAGDFSHRIDRPGEFSAAEIVAGRKRVVAAARHFGKFSLTAPVAPMAELIAEGHQYFSVASDVVALGNSFKESLRRVKAESRRSRSDQRKNL